MKDRVIGLMPYPVIDLRTLTESLVGGDKEWDYILDERGVSNDSGILHWVDTDESTPVIDRYLLINGFKPHDKVLFYISW